MIFWCIGAERVSLTSTGGGNVNKCEIMAAMCEATRKAEAGLNAESEEGAAYKRHLSAQLERRLRRIEPEIDIHTCADFSRLGVECCPVCHDECPDELENHRNRVGRESMALLLAGPCP